MYLWHICVLLHDGLLDGSKLEVCVGFSVGDWIAVGAFEGLTTTKHNIMFNVLCTFSFSNHTPKKNEKRKFTILSKSKSQNYTL